MRWFIFVLILFAAFSISPGPARGQLEVPRDAFEFDPHLTGQGERMNYGPFLSYSLISADRKVEGEGKKSKIKLDYGLRTGLPEEIFLRCINVYLGGKYTAAFDTETCAWAAVWSGGFLNIDGTNLNGYKGETLGHLRLPAILQNGPALGWSTGTSKGDAPHYKGLYLHGWKTILSYKVGKSQVLELPAMFVKGKAAVFCRTIHIDASPVERTLHLFDLPGAHTYLSDKQGGRALTTYKAKGTHISIGVLGLEPDFRFNSGLVHLVVPPLKKATTFKVFMGRDVRLDQLSEIMDDGKKMEDLPALCKGGPGRWQETLTLRGRLGAHDQAYTVDTIPLPEKNPWNSWLRPGAFDFFKDGRAALCTWNGDVWLVSGLDDRLDKVTWRRHATGLYEALGLRIVNDVIYVLGRDQITRLHDLNGDGEADFYENFNNDGPTAPSFHSFAMELHTDSQGHFYYSRGSHRVKEGTPMHGGVIKVWRDGSKAELICTGFREANGMSVGPDDIITIADNQGNNVPTSKIDIVRHGGWYGYPWGVTKPYPRPVLPLCWIPHKEDNSSGGQAWVTSDKWGPFKGHMVHTAYGSSKLFHVFMQRDGDQFQGGVQAMPLEFDSGIMRARFHPLDGQLYVCGLKGWGSNAKKDGCFQRVRYTGKPVTLAKDLRVVRGKVDITFPQALDRDSCPASKVEVEQWTYVWWSNNYGSKDFSMANPGQVGRDKVKVESTTLSPDGKTLSLHIRELQPVMQMGIYLKELRAQDGTPLPTTIYHTINYLP